MVKMLVEGMMNQNCNLFLCVGDLVSTFDSSNDAGANVHF